MGIIFQAICVNASSTKNMFFQKSSKACLIFHVFIGKVRTAILNDSTVIFLHFGRSSCPGRHQMHKKRRKTKHFVDARPGKDATCSLNLTRHDRPARPANQTYIHKNPARFSRRLNSRSHCLWHFCLCQTHLYLLPNTSSPSACAL